MFFLNAILVFLFVAIPLSADGANALRDIDRLSKAGLLYIDAHGQPLVSKRATQRFIPASTTKVVTAWLALTHWGESHRFTTDFYWNPENKTLWVKGRGDPFLVSEELDLIAERLMLSGLRTIETIGLDTSSFQANLVLPGNGCTDNPYDAVPSTVAANFNTVNVKKINGRVVSAEPQTPLTPFAKQLARRIRRGTLRVNTGCSPRQAEHYFAELLAALLRDKRIAVGTRIVVGRVPDGPVFYRHVSSRNLGQVIRPMLKHSTNFIANQLVLMLSAEQCRCSVGASDVQRYMEETLAKQFQWRNFTLKDGAGLSRANRLSPLQLVELLQAFERWKHLMPKIETAVYAKTGTLNKVSALAGYIVANQRWQPFALMINQSVSPNYRNRVARALAAR